MAHAASNGLLALGLLLGFNTVASATPRRWAGNGHYYEAKVVPGGVSWTDARARAVAAGGYLATLTSTAENAFVYDSLVDQPQYWNQEPGGSDLGPWLGGYQSSDDGSHPLNNWVWVTAEPWSYTNWSSGEPNNYTGSAENYLSFKCYGTPGCRSGQWNDLPDNISVYGTAVVAYLVEWESDPALVDDARSRPLSLLVSPNPGWAEVRIAVSGSGSGGIQLGIYNSEGRCVRRLISGPSGVTNWDGRNDEGRRLPAGIYFVRANTASSTVIRRVALVR